MGLGEWLSRAPTSAGAAASTEFASAVDLDHVLLRRARPGHGGAWVPAGQVATVGGLQIPGPAYVGSRLPAADPACGIEPALIDPRLPVDWNAPDLGGDSMRYWPVYRRMTPASRAAYLSWLTAGRPAGASIGYVFLFVYGLERRALHDAGLDPAARTDRPAILAEVTRLTAEYADNRSLGRYAEAFLDTVEAQHHAEDGPAGLDRLVARPAPQPINRRRTPAILRVGLAHLANVERPVPADWAMVWAMTRPSARFAMPARRCPEELSALFAARYRDRFGDGAVLAGRDAPEAALMLSYRAASPGFGDPVTIRLPGLRDVTETPIGAPLQDLLDQCVRDLEPYSRLVGRDPGLARSVGGAALLPPDVGARAAGTARLGEWAETRLAGQDQVAIDGAELAAQWLGRAATASAGRKAVPAARRASAGPIRRRCSRC